MEDERMRIERNRFYNLGFLSDIVCWILCIYILKIWQEFLNIPTVLFS